FSGNALNLGAVRFTTLHVLMVVVAIVLIVILNHAVKHSNAGRQLRAVASDRATASLLGVDVHRVSSGVFFIGGALGGLAAAFIAMAFNDVNADLGSAYLLIAFAAMVVAGFGSVIGMLAGGTLIGIASTLVTGYMAGSYRDLVIFALLL